MIPDKCGMPDLYDLDVPLKHFLIIRLLALGDEGLSHKAGLYRRNFVRLVDKAVYEYQAARAALVAQVEERHRTVEEMTEEGRIIYIFGFIDHLETCISATRRLLHLLDRIKSEQGALSVPRLTRRSIEAYSKSVKDIRNTIEHMAEKIQSDELKDGEPIMLRAGDKGDRAEIAGNYIKFSDLAYTLCKLHEVALHLIEHSDNVKSVRS
jgi:hypothetical protein